MTNGTERFYALVVTMARDTIIFDQLLVKGDIFFLFFNEQAFCGFLANLIYFVARDAFLLWAADEGGMAGKTVCGKFSMGINGFSWTDHQLW